MENRAEQFRQVNAVIEILKDARPLCEDQEVAGLVESALQGAQTLQQMMAEDAWPILAAGQLPAVLGFPPSPGESCPPADVAELCFPV
jgi:hypothetical protein